MLAGVVEGVEDHLLAHDVGGVARGADEEGVGGGQGGEEFGARQRVGGGVREQAPAEDGTGAGDLGVPLRVQPPRPLGAGDDPGVHRIGPGGRGARAGGEGEHPRGGGPGRGRPGGGDEPPDVGALAQVVGGDVAEQEGVEDALADVVAQVAREDGVGDFSMRVAASASLAPKISPWRR